ncbi:hypothetical protein [Streptomyces pseudovenezuelae]|uniref:hypothetical protein n=1 Tax=Streptomyces pseudovenezuelae TaxID=67350 RepID=UPI0036E36001
MLAFLLMDRLYEAHPDPWINHGLRSYGSACMPGRWCFCSPGLHRFVHDPARPAAERARALL